MSWGTPALGVFFLPGARDSYRELSPPEPNTYLPRRYGYWGQSMESELEYTDKCCPRTS